MLIKCPECGKDGVSDSAERCPGCGYNIKEHFEKIKKEGQIQVQMEQAKRDEELRLQKIKEENERKVVCPECEKEIFAKQRICPYCGFDMEDKDSLLKIREIERLKHEKDEISMANNYFCIGGAIFVGSLCLVFLIIWWYFWFVLGILFGIFGVIVNVSDINQKKSKIKSIDEEVIKAEEDFDSYKEKHEKIIKMRRELGYYGEELKIEAPQNNKTNNTTNNTNSTYQIKCPNCGSSKVVRISTANRAASVLAVGIASGKIGKQFECKNCKYKW